MTSLASIEVLTADGEPVLLGDLVDRPTILVVPRYYGCLPCRAQLREISNRYAEVEAAGAAALSVSVGADFQARWLRDEMGIRFPLLVDPERMVHEALELPRRWWVALHPKGWWKYVRALVRGNRQGRIVDPIQLPGLALLDTDATVLTVHRGKALGDYPPLDRVLEELQSVTTR